ncbi:general substrate transporter [Lichtheimia hyalospora FSU 10163]|nr:general substrate transporter [Lichtheimia hyalospora FSU 10163]
MFYCVLVAAIGSFCNGWVIGSPNVPGDITHNCPNGNAHINDPRMPDCLPMNTTLWGFAVSSFCVGGLVAGLAGGYIQTYLGRKKAIAVNTFGWIVGGILMGAAVHEGMFIVGRLIAGLSCGLGSVCIPTYIGEISTIKARGAMGTCHQFFIVIGILLASVIGLPTATVPLWRLNFSLVGIPALVQLFLVVTVVDSPRWLVSVNRVEDARSALHRLRGKNASIDAEFYEIVSAQLGPAAAASTVSDPEFASNPVEEEEALHDDSATATEKMRQRSEEIHGDTQLHNREPLSLIGIFKDTLVRHITIIVLFLHFTQQWIGMNAVMFYSTIIFSEAFNQDMSKYMAIATTGVNFVATLFSVILIDRMGRRPLVMLSLAGCVIFSMLLVIGYRFQIPALLVVAVFLYVASFAIGIGPIPWMITSELCPTYANSAVSAAATCMNWSMNFVIGLVFPIIFEEIAGYTFCIFIGVGTVAFVITYIFVPETKGRSIEKIVRDLRAGTKAKTKVLPQKAQEDKEKSKEVESTQEDSTTVGP